MAEMFPLVENPKYTEQYDSFAELRVAAEGLTLGLNQIQSWFLYDQYDEEWGNNFDGEADRPTFQLCICMPRKTAFTVWSTNQFDRDEVEQWLRTWVFGHIRDWYGMPS